MQWDLTGDAAVIGPPPRASIDLGTGTLALPLSSEELEVPYYLNAHYWWGYIHPTAAQLFERQWLINLILWGNYARLRDAVMAEMGDPLPGRTLQVACAYGDPTTRLSARVADGGLMDIVDVLPIQLSNLCKKLPRNAPVRLLAMDSSNLNFPDASYDRALVFFLLHEQPSQYRERTLSELCRVVKPGGTATRGSSGKISMASLARIRATARSASRADAADASTIAVMRMPPGGQYANQCATCGTAVSYA
jgi:ubiquinone/menaquinone biosynthesis C-methylase UbiE